MDALGVAVAMVHQLAGAHRNVTLTEVEVHWCRSGELTLLGTEMVIQAQILNARGEWTWA